MGDVGEVKKYLVASAFFLANNEIVSIAALIVIVGMFAWALLKAAAERDGV